MYNRKLVFLHIIAKQKKEVLIAKKSLESFCYKDTIGMGSVGVWTRPVCVIDGLSAHFTGH